MNLKLFSLPLIAIALLVGLNNANAKGQLNPHQRDVKRCNHDARMAADRLAKQFNAVDTNANGSLDQSETTAVQIAARCFRHLDSNNDGALSATELQSLS